MCTRARVQGWFTVQYSSAVPSPGDLSCLPSHYLQAISMLSTLAMSVWGLSAKTRWLHPSVWLTGACPSVMT